MMNPSFYFTLFKKFQVLNHVPAGTHHGNVGSPSGGFDLNDPSSVFGSSNSGTLLGASTLPNESPIWAILNSRAMGNAGFSPVTVPGSPNTWPTMPPTLLQSWTDFQVNPSTKLVDVLGSWIQSGKTNDVPTGVIGQKPAPIASGLDAGVVLFVCTKPGDDGVGGVPSNYWATSLIFLVDPANGSIANPSNLAAGSEYYLTAVIGNRGSVDGGQYLSPAGPRLETAAWVMVWNTGMGPGVQLPALSNLDVNGTGGIYEVYFLKSGQYDVVGFRLNVQTVFDGLVKAVDASGANLGGLTAEEWVRAQGAHLCAKVVARIEGDAWPLAGDTPQTTRRIAQKNLAPFKMDVAVFSPDPSIIWKNFMMGDMLKFMMAEGWFDSRWGQNELTLHAKLPKDAFRLHLAIPSRSFERWFEKGSIKGWRRARAGQLLRESAPPGHVVLTLVDEQNAIALPPLRDEFLAMSLGIEYSISKLKPGRLGEITMTQTTTAPRVDAEKKCYEIKPMTVGGFTLELEAYDSRRVPRASKRRDR